MVPLNMNGAALCAVVDIWDTTTAPDKELTTALSVCRLKLPQCNPRIAFPCTPVTPAAYKFSEPPILAPSKACA